MRLSHLIAVAGVSLIAGLWTGCTVDLTADEEPIYQCLSDDDCIDGYECRSDGLCHKLSVDIDPLCIDKDNDGYGVGTIEERKKCSLCETLGLCDEDCDDNDKTRSPGAGEACNGRDDNCNDDIDEPTLCESTQDCLALSPYIPANTSVTCENQQCVVKMNTQICATEGCPCNADPIACEASAYAPVPDPSECL